MMLRILPLCLFLFFVLPDKRLHAQYTARATAPSHSVYIGERFLLIISTVHDFEEAPEFPPPSADSTIFGDLEALQVISQGRSRLDASYRIDSIVYDVTTFALDSAVIPSIRMTVPGDTVQIRSSPLVIPVISVVPADADTILDMAPPVEFERPDLGGAPFWPWFLLALAALILIGTAWYLYTRRKNRVVLDALPKGPKRSPYEVAMLRLNALDKTDLSQKNSEIPYFVELSEALRAYLEHRIDVPALEMTTREVLDALATMRYKIPGGVPDTVRRVLTLSDLVKFAEHIPPPEESTAALTQAKHAVDRLEEKQLQLERSAAREEEMKTDR